MFKIQIMATCMQPFITKQWCWLLFAL